MGAIRIKVLIPLYRDLLPPGFSPPSQVSGMAARECRFGRRPLDQRQAVLGYVVPVAWLVTQVGVIMVFGYGLIIMLHTGHSMVGLRKNGSVGKRKRLSGN